MLRSRSLVLLSGIIVLAFAISISCSCKKQSSGKLIIDVNSGHEIQEGSSGFNVRIADKVWSYSHPDFIAAVHGLKPGWLRYFSGTMGDAFNGATGLYDKDYASMFNHQKQYLKGYEYTQVKGPHRIIDLYELLGEVGGKLVVTINGFSETPQVAGEMARFCKNNNIEVEVWQFCNEPYFYVPQRNLYWWNDGYDYAAKMKPYADSIKAVYPDAKLALNCTWDGIWGFMKEIHQYQEENGAYWNVFSKHSYAPHVGKKQTFEEAYQRANTKIIEVTSPEAMAEIESYSWKDTPLLITEFGVWNTPLNGIFSAIYNAEYTLRQLHHTNAFYIASHEISNKYRPGKNYKTAISEAYSKGEKINTEELLTGIVKDDEGKAFELVHEATNHSNYTWDVQIEGGAKVEGMKNTLVDALYARAFKGVDGFDYLLVTNRSGKYHDFSVLMGDEELNKKAERSYMFSEKAQSKDVEVITDQVELDNVQVPPYSVVLLKWSSDRLDLPSVPRIYKSKITDKGVELTWWKRDNALKYRVSYGETPDDLNQSVLIEDSDMNFCVIPNLPAAKTFYFGVQAINEAGTSNRSDLVKLTMEIPEQPTIFKTAKRDTTITVMWKSVPNAIGYKVKVKAPHFNREYDANNVFGYRIEGLAYDVPYSISVSAYNGLGESSASESAVVTCKEQLPIPPRNISAKETKAGAVYLEWITQDTINPDVKYRLYRGKTLYDYKPFAEDIEENHYLDTSVKAGENYYYTVKAYNADGECSFYPNSATIIKYDKVQNIELSQVVLKEDHYEITVHFNNMKDKLVDVYGVALSDISYLNVEEDLFESTEVNEDSFVVKIPLTKLKKGSTYAVRGFIKTKVGYTYSMPPHQKFKF
jgi:fibronectin type 3 domain-containing protein